MGWYIAWTVIGLIFVAFSFVIVYGAPFLPTLKKQVPAALDLIGLKPGQTLLELGSGDGRILQAAAERGIHATGYELNPILVLYSRLRARKHKGMIKVVWGNYWHKTWPATDGIFVFLLNPYMKKLDTKIVQECKKPVKLVSFAFKIPGKKPIHKRTGLYLYEYH